MTEIQLHQKKLKQKWSNVQSNSKTDLAEIIFSEYIEFLEKYQLQKFQRHSSSLQWFLFKTHLTAFAKVGNIVFFPVIL